MAYPPDIYYHHQQWLQHQHLQQLQYHRHPHANVWQQQQQQQQMQMQMQKQMQQPFLPPGAFPGVPRYVDESIVQAAHAILLLKDTAVENGAGARQMVPITLANRGRGE